MEKHIYKYALPAPFETVDVELPAEARFVHVGMQGRDLMGWAEVDPGAATGMFPITTVPTGARVPPNARHLGTVVDGPYVWHVYGAFV